MFFSSESGPAHRVLGVCIDKYAKCVCRHVCEVSLKQSMTVVLSLAKDAALVLSRDLISTILPV